MDEFENPIDLSDMGSMADFEDIQPRV